MNKKICAYPGTFGPITHGHSWIIGEALKLFDEVHVIVAENPAKKNVFSAKKRMILIQDLVKNPPKKDRVHVTLGDEDYTVEIAHKLKATHIIRGIRSGVDFDYERSIDLVNRDIAFALQTEFDRIQIATLYMAPPPDLANVSSSMVMSLVGFKNWEKVVKRYVSKNVFDAIEDAYQQGLLPRKP